jgi:alkanesulfonate monooxygenase SsuD/methylene tetrahydromethanopterin reductase-like flavin-dependent oxidoreductase (luciferase family)
MRHIGLFLEELRGGATDASFFAELMAIATRTRRVCTGTAVHVTPLRSPLSIAEDVATLDHMSGGRFELGNGRSGSALPTRINTLSRRTRRPMGAAARR